METEAPNQPILVAIDGEPHTDAAVAQAIAAAKERSAWLVGIHVMDPYLKQFYNEIYAQGREEYLAHVDDCLERAADHATQRFDDVARSAGIPHRVLVRHGRPEQEIVKEVASSNYQLVVFGLRERKGFEKMRPPHLPFRFKASLPDYPTLVTAVEKL